MIPIRTLFTIGTIYFQLNEINSQSIFNPIKAPGLSGIGGQSVVSKSAEAFQGNASNLASIKNSTLSFNGESRFVGSGIAGSSILAGIKLGPYNGLGLSTVYYGLAEYNQLNLMAGYGMYLSKQIAIGTSGGMVHFNNPSGDKTTLGMISFGIQYQVFANLHLGVSYQRLLAHHSLQGKTAGNALLIGTRYSLSTLVSVYTEIEKDRFSKANIKAGIEYQMMNSFIIRTGVTSYPQSFSSGMGVALNSLIYLDTSFSFYQSIGFTPALGIKFHFNKPSE